jgi:hypothetical protein
MSRFTPITTATPIEPDSIAATAWWSATMDDEHAVSMVRLGPVRSKACETRFEISDSVLPSMK